MFLKLLTIDTGILAIRSLSPSVKHYFILHPTMMRYFFYLLVTLISLVIPLHQYESLVVLLLATTCCRYIISSLAIDIVYNDLMQVINNISYSFVCKITIYYLSELCGGTIPQKDVDELYGRISKYSTTSLGKKFVGILLYNKFYTLLGYHNHKYQVQITTDETLIFNIIKTKGVAKLLSNKYLTITLNVLYFRYTTLRSGVDSFFLQLRNIYAYYNLYLLLILVFKLILPTSTEVGSSIIIDRYYLLILNLAAIITQLSLAFILHHLTMRQPLISYIVMLSLIINQLAVIVPFILPLLLLWPHNLTLLVITKGLRYIIANINWLINIKYTILMAVIAYNISRPIDIVSYLSINLLILAHQLIKLLLLLFNRCETTFDYELIESHNVISPGIVAVELCSDIKSVTTVEAKQDVTTAEDDDYVLI